MDHLTKDQRSRQMALIRSRDTTPEFVVRRIVSAAGFRYRLHVKSLPGCPDIVLPSSRKIILVHGCFWHGHHCRRGNRIPQTRTEYWQAKIGRNKARDKVNKRTLKKLGWNIATVWECQTSAASQQHLSRRLAAFLASR